MFYYKTKPDFFSFGSFFGRENIWHQSLDRFKEIRPLSLFDCINTLIRNEMSMSISNFISFFAANEFKNSKRNSSRSWKEHPEQKSNSCNNNKFQIFFIYTRLHLK